ncbi:MAG TPA: hypothetical protein VJP86_14780 [Vicinamibacterales bacterium]|nr:hypothetical protein [Vicinamibacterales bacterium]
MGAANPVVVFADVSQAFLNRDAVSGAGEWLAAEDIILVLCSSTTRAELEVYQQKLGIRQPLICESGAAILVPNRYFPFEVACDRHLTGYQVVEFGRPYGEVVALLRRAAAYVDCEIVGFADLSIEQVAHDCGLTLAQARLAKLRDYDEAFRLVKPSPDALRRLWRALRAGRLQCTCRGSLYDHVGASVDRGACAAVLARWFRRWLGNVITVGLGDPRHLSSLLGQVDLLFMDASQHSTALPQLPRLNVGDSHSEWIDALCEMARHARRQHRLNRRMSAVG